MNILITGAAGFIGFHLVKKLTDNKDFQIIGIDNLNDYYSVDLKYDRLQQCGINREAVTENSIAGSSIHPNYLFAKVDLVDEAALENLFKEYSFDVVINLAAQAGVRYSLEQPRKYIQSNIVGFTNILEYCRHYHTKHLIYASSSSVYGMNNPAPFSEDDNVDYPVSLYAATKKSNELMAHTYSHLYQLPTTGLRFFTVYGAWGRPDMAPILFASAITKGETISLFNNGNMLRDFTYIDDIIEAIVKLVDKTPGKDAVHPFYEIFNIGNSNPVELSEFVQTLENELGKKAITKLCPMQSGDVKITCADTQKLKSYIGYAPKTPLKEGIATFVKWFEEYYKY